MAPPISEDDLGHFKRRVFVAMGLHLESYKEEQINRRLLTLLERSECVDLNAYFQYINQDPAHFQQFIEQITINETFFFRNAERFKELKKQISEWQGRPHIKVWSAGCSFGAEPYSLLLLFDSLKLTQKTQFSASDIDPKVLTLAREGVYAKTVLQNVSQTDLSYYFERAPIHLSDHYLVKKEWRQKIKFEQHDLLKDPYPQSLDLIACRNVLIYFNDKAKNGVYQGFHKALKDNGLLFLGGSERIPNCLELGFEQLTPFLYQKVAK